ncbi:MAG: GAF domain-containing protein [Candidatus Omnitrophica bacterium]|nr:GAF domain-containing protein [Candidatus Omnitrophota bacterium]
MNPGIFHPYVVTGYLTAFTTLAVGVFVYLKNKSSSLHRVFLIYSLTIVWWSFFTALQGMQTDIRWALVWGRLCHVGVLLIPAFFYYFTTKITGRKNPILLKIGFFISFILTIPMLFTPFFIPTERTDAGVNFLPAPGPGYIVIILFFCAYVLLSLAELWKERSRSSGPRKKHMDYFFWASLIGYGVGVVNFFPVYGFVFFPYPYSAACGSIYFFVLGYAIIKHRFLDIELIIKKGIVFTFLFLTVSIAVSLFVFTLGLFLSKAPVSFLSGLSIVLAMFLYEPLKKTLTHLTNRFLFQKKIPYTSLIQTLTDKLATTQDTRSLAEETVQFLTGELGIEWVAFYLAEREGPSFKLRSSMNANAPSGLKASDPLIQILLSRKTPVLISPFDTEDGLSSEIRSRLRQERMEALIPIFIQEQLQGVLCLGKKKSDEEFTRDDELLFQTLQEEAEMFFLSRELLKEEVRSHLELGERMKMTAVTQLARGVHHQVKNPLHAILLHAQAILQKDHEGDYKHICTERFQKLIGTRINFMIEQIKRIQHSLGTFAQFAHPAEDFELKPFSLEAELRAFFTVMRDGMKLYGIEVLCQIPEETRVLASEESLKAIFFNLFNNAYEAMEGKGKLFIEASTNHEWVELKMRDTGPGIPQEILPNIFEPFFSTKKNTEAIGIGLSTVKHCVKELGGLIEVSTPKDGGAQFTVKFRKAELGAKARAA